VAGLAGALVATAAICGPSCLVAYFVGSSGNTSRPRAGRIAVQGGLVPFSIGLLGAGAILLARVADHNWIALAVTAGTAAIAYGSRLTRSGCSPSGAARVDWADLSGRGSKGLQRRDPLC
jgi:chromate transporter